MDAGVINKQAYQAQVQRMQNEVIQGISSTIDSISDIEDWEVPSALDEVYRLCRQNLENKISNVYPNKRYIELTHFALSTCERRFYEEEVAKVKSLLKRRCCSC